MTGRAFLAVPGFLRVPERVQERTGGASIAVCPSQKEKWSQNRTIIPDSYLPDQERPGQERKKARVAAGLPFLIPGVPEKPPGRRFRRYFNLLASVPGFLPSLKRGAV
jgi:hypothetical protein